MLRLAVLLLGSLTALFHLSRSELAADRATHILPIRSSKKEEYANPEYGFQSALFNEIHSSAKQWGSSVNVNGFTIFRAIVPQGTKFYHGRSNADLPASPEWLAFEMEQGSFFAGKGHGRYNRTRPGHHSIDLLEALERRRKSFVQQDIDASDTSFRSSGYIHTFETTRPLRLMYFNGMSAAPSPHGTQDMQNIMTSQSLQWDGDEFRHPDIMAEKLCSWQAAQKFNLDGFMRMEANFEIIFCDFKSKALKHVSTIEKQVIASKYQREFEYRSFEFLKAATRNYHGIQGNRVYLDYSSFVTAYRPGWDIDYNDSRPRLLNLTEHQTNSLRSEVQSVFSKDFNAQSINWRDYTDRIVTRYSDKICSLLHYTNSKSFDAIVVSAMANYVDASRNRTEALDRCIYDLLPDRITSTDQVTYSALESVMAVICGTFLDIYPPSSDRVEKVTRLMKYLRWSTWKECRPGCQPWEICMIPMFPFGSKQDFENPRCVDHRKLSQGEHMGFWR